MAVIKKPWTQKEIDILFEMYPDHYAKDVAKMLGRPTSQVYGKCGKLKIKKSEQFLKKELQNQGDRLRKIGEKSRFKKGSQAYNKGKKVSPELYAVLKRTMFKKGHEPHNSNYDGHIRITKDGYKEIRIRKGKYRLMHLVNWEKINGKLPKGHCLRCLDHNILNTDPSNWELITRAENMNRNTIHRYPQEVKELIKLTSKIKRKIQDHEKQN